MIVLTCWFPSVAGVSVPIAISPVFVYAAFAWKLPIAGYGADGAFGALKRQVRDLAPTARTALRGNRGPEGWPGATGPQGVQGSAGPRGLTGATGPAGKSFPKYTIEQDLRELCQAVKEIQNTVPAPGYFGWYPDFRYSICSYLY